MGQRTYAENMPLNAAFDSEAGERGLDTYSRVAMRLTQLRRKLAARKGNPGYDKNVEAIEAEIARLEAITAAPAKD